MAHNSELTYFSYQEMPCLEPGRSCDCLISVGGQEYNLTPAQVFPFMQALHKDVTKNITNAYIDSVPTHGQYHSQEEPLSKVFRVLATMDLPLEKLTLGKNCFCGWAAACLPRFLDSVQKSVKEFDFYIHKNSVMYMPDLQAAMSRFKAVVSLRMGVATDALYNESILQSMIKEAHSLKSLAIQMPNDSKMSANLAFSFVSTGQHLSDFQINLDCNLLSKYANVVMQEKLNVTSNNGDHPLKSIETLSILAGDSISLPVARPLTPAGRPLFPLLKKVHILDDSLSREAINGFISWFLQENAFGSQERHIIIDASKSDVYDQIGAGGQRGWYRSAQEIKKHIGHPVASVQHMGNVVEVKIKYFSARITMSVRIRLT